MSFRADLAAWLHVAEPTNCPVCRQDPMPNDMVVITGLSHTWLSVEPVDCLKGACHLVAKRHAFALYELADDELLGLMRDLAHCARALKAVTQAVKINYEIHGNSVPHLHAHLYPRYLDDPFPGRPIDYHRRVPQYVPGEFERFVDAMRAEMATDS